MKTIVFNQNMEASEQILMQIKKSSKPLKGGEIAELTGIDKKTIDKTLKKLLTDGKLYSPVRCFYDIKK